MTRVPEELKFELAGILERLDSSKWQRLEELLAEGKAGTMYGLLNLAPLGKEGVRELMDAASDLMHHDRNIRQHRLELHDLIQNALSGIHLAERKIKVLDELGDVEYEGGSADLEAFLADAARCLRAAQALKPTDREGK